MKSQDHRVVVEGPFILFELRNVRRLADILLGRVCVKGVWQELLLDPKVLAAVPAPPDSTQPSRPKRLSEFVSRLHQRFGYVLRISSLGFVSDTVSFVMQGNPVLLVVDVQDICRWVSRQSTRNPEAVRAKVIGTTMVNVRLSKVEYC